MNTVNLFSTSKITLEDILKLKQQLVTHYCLVHDEELKREIEKAGISEIDVKVTPYIEKGQIILIDKKMCEGV